MEIFLSKILSFIFGKNVYLCTMIISMCPLVELKGAIPIGMSSELWGDNALVGIQAFLISLVGSSIIIFLLPVFFEKVINLCKKTKTFKKVALAVEKRTLEKSQKLQQRGNGVGVRWLSIFLFVAVPIPLTGVWTGSCVAVALKLNYWQTVSAVFFGNWLAGFLVFFVCRVFPSFIMWLIYFIIAILLIGFILFVVKMVKKKKGAND